MKLPAPIGRGDRRASSLAVGAWLWAREDEYQSTGLLMYINWDGQLTADYGRLAKNRIARFHMRVNQLGAAEAIVEAYSSAQNGQYDQAICGSLSGASNGVLEPVATGR